jgi:DNA-binding CsgD family transcriptional regulator
MNDDSESTSVWDQVAPLLDEAMTGLGATDRDAVVLRFLEGRTFAEVASALGTSEAAAKMRVGRALEKLRHALGRRGAVVSVAALATALSTHAVSAMPAGLAASVVGTALAPTSTINSTVAPLVSGAIKLMAYNKLKISFAAAAAALLILGGAVVSTYQWRPAPVRSLVVNTFEPMTGEWEGTYESRGDGIPAAVRQKVALSVRTTSQGRSCEIEMRVLDDADRTNEVFHFTHTLNDSGDRIITADDPRIRRIGGDGLVTEAVHDQTTGEWRAAFHASRPGSSDFTECRWVRRGDELIISRQDVFVTALGSNRLFSDLMLRRRGA